MNFTAANSSDPDRHTLRYSWWNYPEAGRQPYGKSISIINPIAENIEHTVPADDTGTEIHLILEVWDNHTSVPLVDYRRAVILVKE